MRSSARTTCKCPVRVGFTVYEMSPVWFRASYITFKKTFIMLCMSMPIVYVSRSTTHSFGLFSDNNTQASG